MNKADFIGTVSFDFLDSSASNWTAGTTNDMIQDGLITLPPDYFFTLGSGVQSTMTSLATTPAYQLPTKSQFYLAGRDVFRWGGFHDPFEVDIDHYGFTPDYIREVAIIWKAPKSEPHHLSEMPELLVHLPDDWKEFCQAIINKQLQ